MHAGHRDRGDCAAIREDLNNIPWLDISFDLQKSTNVQTRLEAFMYQAQHFQRLQQEMATAA